MIFPDRYVQRADKQKLSLIKLSVDMVRKTLIESICQ